MDATNLLKHLREVSNRYNMNTFEISAMQFEYDERKSETNLNKHGIDFDEVQELWSGDTVSFRADVKGESRYKVIGRIEGEYWAVIHTMRGERIRIISARRATANERSEYDKRIDKRR